MKKIAQTRIGRCSEWSMLFGAILNSLSFPTRIVHDYLDHCWNETYIRSSWIHIDSTLEYPISFNHPHYYEQNWSKEYEHVIAFSSNRIEDVTRFYTEKWDNEVLIRRKKNKTDKKISMISPNHGTQLRHQNISNWHRESDLLLKRHWHRRKYST